MRCIQSFSNSCSAQIADSPVEFHMLEHLLANTSEWMVERMKMELHLNEARKVMRDLGAVELIVARAANVIADLD